MIRLREPFNRKIPSTSVPFSFKKKAAFSHHSGEVSLNEALAVIVGQRNGDFGILDDAFVKGNPKNPMVLNCTAS